MKLFRKIVTVQYAEQLLQVFQNSTADGGSCLFLIGGISKQFCFGRVAEKTAFHNDGGACGPPEQIIAAVGLDDPGPGRSQGGI